MSKKKIGIITLHRVRNYGSILQAFALCQIIKELGHDPVVIDYIPERFRLRSDLFYVRPDRYTSKTGKKNRIIKLFFSIASILPRLYYYSRFAFFVKKNIPLSKRQYFSNDQLKKAMFDFDIYMNGSDQVWNMAWENEVDKSFFLDFIPDNCIRCAYAASFGKNCLPDDEIKVMKPLIQKYSSISVREFSGINILENLGYFGAKYVLDPTLLFSKERWIDNIGERKIKEKYVLVYQLFHKTPTVKFARKIADQIGVKVADLSRKIKNVSEVDINLPFVTPVDFLNFFYYADFVVTDSFHGTAFSINFNKKFVSISNNFPERVSSLVNMVGLENRFISMESNLDVDKMLKTIDYEVINKILNLERQKSLTELRKMINNER